MADAFICDAVRTPIGRLNGSLSTIRGRSAKSMSGGRSTLSAAGKWQRSGARYAPAFMCGGVGQGIGVILERA